MPQNPFANTLESALEQGVSTAKQTVGNQVQKTGQSVVTQVTGQTSTPSDTTGKSDAQPHEAPQTADQFNETGDAKQAQQNQQNPQVDPVQAAQVEQQKEQENQEKLAETRKKLQAHQQRHDAVYFDPTFNKRPQEQSVQDKLQQEEQQEEQKKMADLEEKKKKDEPIALQRAKTSAESNRGASG